MRHTSRGVFLVIRENSSRDGVEVFDSDVEARMAHIDTGSLITCGAVAYEHFIKDDFIVHGHHPLTKSISNSYS